jgi:acetyl-CoA carboxylase carboxyl transferase subunit alpha
VISPEGCAAILWKDAAMAPRAAEALKLTASDLLALTVIDGIIPEPLGGAHRHPAETFANVEKALVGHLKDLQGLSEAELLQKRFDKYRQMGTFREV